jgi:hypothetical protein
MKKGPRDIWLKSTNQASYNVYIDALTEEISLMALDDLIEHVRSWYDDPPSLEQVREWVVADYEDGDINKIAVQDVVEIIDAVYIHPDMRK